jgi:glycosyltransferase involved in cell wall biosynthesis
MHEFAPWYRISPRVQLRVVRRATPRSTPPSDVYLFTSWLTVQSWPRLRGHAPGIVLVWDYEFWVEAEPPLRASMRAAFAQPDLTLVAGSDAVASMLDSMELPVAATIPPGIDHEVFHPDDDATPRIAAGLLARTGPRRGMDDAILALQEVCAREPETPCLVAGRSDHEFPDWMQPRASETDAELADFYRELAVFILPSKTEGLGLPALEAMACGAAVVVTDNGGSRQYARHGENCLVVPVDDAAAMGDAALSLLRDDALRSRIATAGATTAAMYTWERAADALERLLIDATARP